MAFLKNCLKKAIPALLVLALCLPLLPITAAAEEAGTLTDDLTLIDPNRNGSITVTKYVGTDPNSTKGNATGTSNDETNISADSYRLLNGAQFSLYKVSAVSVVDYYNGQNTANYTIADFDADNKTFAGGETTLISTLITGGNGQDGVCKFEGLAIGFYVLEEVGVEEGNQIDTPLAEPALISIPMVNTTFADSAAAGSVSGSDNNGSAEWMYDVYVYPKNTAKAKVELIVQDKDGSALGGVTFALLYQNGNPVTDSNGNPIVATSDKTNGGIVALDNLPAGDYQLVAQPVSDSYPEALGYIINQKPLKFKVKANNNVEWPKDTGGNPVKENTNIHSVQESNDVSKGVKLSIIMRFEKPALSLKVHENSTSDVWKQDEQYPIGKTYSNKLEVYIPKNFSEINPDTPYTITVDLDSGISLVNDTIQGENYTGTIAQDGRSFTVLPASEAAGKTLTVDFDTYLNGSAVIAGDGNETKAEVTYPELINPVGTDVTTYQLEDYTKVYTYDFQITKFKDSATSGNELAGVEFELYKNSKTGTKVPLYETASGEYRPCVGNEVAGTIKTGTGGKLHISGLEAADYYLKETKTISGYNLLSDAHNVDLKIVRTTKWIADSNGFKDDVYVANCYDKTEYTTPAIQSSIINKKGFTLPRTGSMGYLLFCTVGILLIGGGAMLLFGGRKKKIR